MLASDAQARSFIERPAAAGARDILKNQNTQSMIGHTIGPYKITGTLGAGGMGEVYRARDTRLDRTVAIKVLPAEFSADADRLRRFDKEARAASALNHPNIVTIYEVGSSGTTSFIAMELVEGETLQSLLAESRLSMKRLLAIAAPVADGLAKAHEAGIVHRDLKPANLMVTRDGFVKILDFGLAKLMHPPADSGDETDTSTISAGTDSGVVLGTTGYMSPEQANGKPVDFRTDQFSFGAVLYEMATGKKAFSGPTKLETLAAIIREEPESIAVANPNVPTALRWVIERCLAKAPENRYAATRDLARDLARLRDGLSEAGQSGLSPATIQSRTWARLWPIVAACALLAGIAVGVFTIRRSAPGPPVYHRVTFRRGTVNEARFAPDGKTIVYSALYEGENSKVYWARSDSPESTTLPFQNASLLALSSSGKLAIALLRGANSTLAEVPLAGGAPREILENVSYADWAPDGENLAVIQSRGDRNFLEFPVGNVLYDPGPEVTLSDLKSSPQGDLIAFVEYRVTIWGRSGKASVCVVNRSGKRRVLSSGWGDVFGLAWNPKSNEIWVTAREAAGSSGGLILHAVSLSGEHRVVAGVPGLLIIQDISRDGRVLLKHTEWPSSMICLPPGSTKEVDLTWFDFSSGTDLSDDGKSLLFEEDGIAAGARGATYLRRTDGSPAVRLGEGYGTALSPDGKWAISIPNEMPGQLVLLPVGPGSSRMIETKGIECHSAKWFPDGKRILLNANEVGRPPGLYVLDVASGQPHSITPEGVEMGPVSPDGNFVAARGPGSTFYLYPVPGGQPRAVPGVEPGEQLLRWDADGKTLFLARWNSPSSISIYRLDPATGRREIWKKLGPTDSSGVVYIGDVLFTPDGKAYSYTYRRDLSYFYVVEGLN